MKLHNKIIYTFAICLLILLAFFYGLIKMSSQIPERVMPSMYISCSRESYKYCSCSFNGYNPDIETLKECEKFIENNIN